MPEVDSCLYCASFDNNNLHRLYCGGKVSVVMIALICPCTDGAAGQSNLVLIVKSKLDFDLPMYRRYCRAVESGSNS